MEVSWIGLDKESINSLIFILQKKRKIYCIQLLYLEISAYFQKFMHNKSPKVGIYQSEKLKRTMKNQKLNNIVKH